VKEERADVVRPVSNARRLARRFERAHCDFQLLLMEELVMHARKYVRHVCMCINTEGGEKRWKMVYL